jgi:acyl-CoA thioesterase FadM
MGHHERLEGVPFRVRRVVKWGESDPAGIVYTARFLDYAMETLETWFAETTGIHWSAMNIEIRMGSPAVHVTLDFFAPLACFESFTMTLSLEHIGRSAYTVLVDGYNDDDVHCFQVKVVASIVSKSEDGMKSIPIPPEYRERMEAYQHACKQAAGAE